MKTITIPLSVEALKGLKAGDQVLITGVIYSARDAAHKRMVECLARGEDLPFDVDGQVIYYMGPAPAKPGHAIGAAGPTTSGRMDRYAADLMAHGLKGMIGKGYRNQAVKDAIVKYKSVYFAAIGGAGALIAESIKESSVVAYEELGAEAIRRLVVEEFLVTVINDIYGGDLYIEGKEKFAASCSAL